jgi:hypothetical protein
MAPAMVAHPEARTIGGIPMIDRSIRPEAREEHHGVPRCLLRLHDEATNGELDGEGIQAWLEFEHECMRWGVDAVIGREDLEALVERSTVLLDREDHRLIHQSDWQRWAGAAASPR